MKRITAAIAVLTSLVLAPTALAHPNVTGSATQFCDVPGKIKLTATFSNQGFDAGTTVTATDSGGATLVPSSGGSPFSTTADLPGPDRAAGTVSFAWTASDGDSGTVVAPYDAVSGCESPPPPTTTTTTPPPPPPAHHTGGPPHISTAPHGHSPKGSRPPAAKGPPAGVQSGTLPFSGLPLGVMAVGGFGLLLGGTLLVGVLAQQRYNEARRRRRPHS